MILLENFHSLFMESAPWLLIGLLFAGLVKLLLPKNFLKNELGQEGFLSVLKAAVIGIPLPLCSCGVIPAALGLRKEGASKSATTAFMVSTPETGVDSISVSYALLGPFLAVIRPIAAFCSAVVAGLLVGHDSESSAQDPQKQSNCCNKMAQEDQEASLSARIRSTLKYVAVDMIDDISFWLVLGLFFAAVVQTYVPQDFMLVWGQGLLGMLLMLMISIPMYICATASTPIAAGLLMAGVSPGAALVFMLAGPATNVATLSVVFTALGRRAVVAYLIGVVGVALLFGFLTNALVVYWSLDIAAQISVSEHMLPHGVHWVATWLLAGLICYSTLKKLLRCYKDKISCV
jgi:uncharacterized membrane protein YraQ (UPF0718 family)